MKKVRRRVMPLARSTSRSSVATNSAPTDQVHFFCQMMFDCRSMPAARVAMRASKAGRSIWLNAT